MASFRKITDKNGRTVSWYVTWDIGTDENGKRLQSKKRGFATKKDAEAWYNEYKKNIDKGIPVNAQKSKITLGVWLDTHINTIVSVARTAKTHESYLSVQKFWKKELGHVKLNDLTLGHVQNIVKILVDNEKSPRTIRNYISYLSKAMNDAVAHGLAVRNPIVKKSLNVPRAQEELHNISWTQEDLQQLFNHFKDTHFYALIYLAMSTGARKGELLGLKWKDLDMENMEIHFHASRAAITKEIINKNKNYGKIKTYKDRYVNITQDVVQVLEKNKENIINLGFTANDDDYIFTSYFCGRPLSTFEITKKYNNAQKKLGLKHITFHDLRHLYASFCVDAGIPLPIVSKILGHSKISITADTYTHAIQRKQRQYTQQISDAIGIKDMIKDI